MIYGGIDIGASGFIVLIKENTIDKFPIKDNLSFIKIIKQFQDTKHHFYIEDLHAIFGSSASSNFSFGYNNGYIFGILDSFNISYTKVTPKTWQKDMFKNIDPILNTKISKGKAKLDTKAMSIQCSKTFHPNFDLRISERARVDDHNVSDALLLATYCKIKENGINN